MSTPSSTYLRIAFETFGGEDAVRKRGDEYRLRREIEATQYVRKNTSIPVPRILESRLDPDNPGGASNWIVMEKLPGTQMGTVWPSMSNSAQSNTLTRLKSYLQQLHALLPPKPGWIGSCSGGPAYDHRITNMKTCGPFSSVGEFHDFLVAPIKNSPRPEWVKKFRDLLPDTHSVNFAHADISWENILVEPETGEVTGILDWEMAGFWPEWWEYRKALCGARSQPWWFKVLKEIMQEYPSETEADMDIEMF